MENASKALLIAGAILISILIIAIGMYIYTSAQGAINNAGDRMSEHEKTIYNSAVLQYCGNNKPGRDVKSLIDAIVASNNTNVDQAGKFITLTFGDTTVKNGENGANTETNVNAAADTMSGLKNSVNMGKRYDIKESYTSGLITKITVNEHGKTTTPKEEEKP